MSVGPGRLLTAGTEPGVTLFDVLGQPHAVETVLELMGRWAEDRALPAAARKRLAYLMGAAVAHGARFEPRALTILVRWIDAKRIRVALRWFGCAEAASPDQDGHVLAATISTLDALAVEWGLGRNGAAWVQWIVADVG